MKVSELEKIMQEHGLVIRAIPSKVRSIYEASHTDAFPDGRLEFLEKYNREMLVVERIPENAGKFIFTASKNTSETVKFLSEEAFDSIEDIVSFVQSSAEYISPKGKYGIEITYSWGDSEGLLGSFLTKEEAYKQACIMAGTEAYVQNEELWEQKPCEVFFDGFKQEVNLHYLSDDTWCYYRIKEIKEET